MYLAGHAAAGALIGQQLGGSPLIIFAMGMVSHFLLDLIPHGDKHHVVDYYHGKKEVLSELYYHLLVDAIITIIMIVVLMSFTTLDRVSMAWGIVGSMIPDLIVGLNEIFNNAKLKAFTKFHFIVHNALIHKLDVSPLQGTLVQIVLIAGMLVAL